MQRSDMNVCDSETRRWRRSISSMFNHYYNPKSIHTFHANRNRRLSRFCVPLALQLPPNQPHKHTTVIFNTTLNESGRLTPPLPPYSILPLTRLTCWTHLCVGGTVTEAMMMMIVGCGASLGDQVEFRFSWKAVVGESLLVLLPVRSSLKAQVQCFFSWCGSVRFETEICALDYYWQAPQNRSERVSVAPRNTKSGRRRVRWPPLSTSFSVATICSSVGYFLLSLPAVFHLNNLWNFGTWSVCQCVRKNMCESEKCTRDIPTSDTL